MSKHMRLDKVLANMGIGSRRDVKRLIKDKAVTVNHQLVQDAGKQVDPQCDTITVNGQQLVYKKYVYMMLHKPAGVISATEDLRQKTVLDLLSPDDRKIPLFPVGRLDKDTEGLLLLTNDGKLAHRLLSPKRHVEKKYYAEVAGWLEEKDVSSFQNGVTLDDGYKTMPAKLCIIAHKMNHGTPISTAFITIMEGKYHQIKRMFASVGKPVLFLKRESMGGLNLDPKLKRGQYRALTAEEVQRLKQISS